MNEAKKRSIVRWIHIVLAIPIIILVFLGLTWTTSRRGSASTVANGFVSGLPILINGGSTILFMLYNWFFLSKYSATPGKMACGLKVVTTSGMALTSRQALGRAASEILSELTCGIGYIMAAFDHEKRALHDHMAGTRVVKK